MKGPLIALIAISIVFINCTQKNNKITEAKLVERIFVANILNGEKPLNEYLHYHESVWPEVEAGFKKAGYKKITLYRFDHSLVMKISVPENADLNAMGRLAESYSSRCVEWNKIMNSYQIGVQGTLAGQTWVEVKPFYIFQNN